MRWVFKCVVVIGLGSLLACEPVSVDRVKSSGCVECVGVSRVYELDVSLLRGEVSSRLCVCGRVVGSDVRLFRLMYVPELSKGVDPLFYHLVMIVSERVGRVPEVGEDVCVQIEVLGGGSWDWNHEYLLALVRVFCTGETKHQTKRVPVRGGSVGLDG